MFGADSYLKVFLRIATVVWSVIVNIIILFAQVFLGTWISSQHNMGMAFYRDTWEKIKRCAPVSIFV